MISLDLSLLTLNYNEHNIGYMKHALAGIPKSEAHKAKISKALKGRLLSEVTKRRMSEARKGRVMSLEARAKISATRLARRIPGLVGPASPKWKGGRYRRLADGYIFILEPGHPNADKRGYVREHVLVMSRKLGRVILPHEIVHHKNGNTGDNHEENLELLTRAQHASHHHRGIVKQVSLKNLQRMTRARAKRIWMTTRAAERKQPKNCMYCQRPFYYTSGLRQKFCGQGCYHAWRRKPLA